MEIKTPTLFISYARSNEEHNKWVYKLAHDLIDKGKLKVHLDEFVRSGENLESFMTHDLANSKNVVCICSYDYYERSKYPNTGVYKELKTLEDMIDNADLDNIIPIIKDNHEKLRPALLSDLKYENADEKEYYSIFGYIRELLWGEDLKKQPYSNEENPFINPRSNELSRRIKDYDVMFHDPNFEGLVQFDYEKSNKEYSIGSGDYTFTTRWSERHTHSINAYRDASNIDAIAYIPGITKMPVSETQILDTYGVESFYPRIHRPEIDELVIWKNKNNKYAVTRIEDVNNDSDRNIHDLTFSYKIIEEP